MPLLILFAAAYGLVLLATPILAISLYVRNARLRKQLNDLAGENARQFTNLQRVVGELQTKVAATVPPPGARVEKPVAPLVHTPVPSAHPEALADHRNFGRAAFVNAAGDYGNGRAEGWPVSIAWPPVPVAHGVIPWPSCG